MRALLTPYLFVLFENLPVKVLFHSDCKINVLTRQMQNTFYGTQHKCQTNKCFVEIYIKHELISTVAIRW